MPLNRHVMMLARRFLQAAHAVYLQKVKKGEAYVNEILL
jgi:hypothetical protein